MSRTRKTRPLQVRMADVKDYGVGYEEVHNHIDGRECDLPENINSKVLNPDSLKYIENNVSCHYSFTYQGVNICGCKMCTGHDIRKHENRKQRHAAKQGLHNALKSRQMDGDEF